MTATYVPQVGDRIRLQHWVHDWIDVKYVSRELVIGVDGYGNERMPWLSEPWVKVEAPIPLPERFMNLNADGGGNTYTSRAVADFQALDHRIAVVRIWTDADGEDRIERVTA